MIDSRMQPRTILPLLVVSLAVKGALALFATRQTITPE